jgi:hypothetical protein
MSEERTGTDVLLDLEKQVAQLVHMNQSLDFNIKVLSNKLNQVIELLNNMSAEAQMDPTMDPIAMATAPQSVMPKMKIEDEWKPAIPITTDTAPVGFRRTSRPETFHNPKTPTKNTPTLSFPVPEMKPPTSVMEPSPNTGKKPLSQRIVDRNGSSVFKADIEVVDEQGHTVWKGQTGMTGKWTTALAPGKYRVNIRKQTTQQKIAVSQDLLVNDKTPADLQPLLVK